MVHTTLWLRFNGTSKGTQCKGEPFIRVTDLPPISTPVLRTKIRPDFNAQLGVQSSNLLNRIQNEGLLFTFPSASMSFLKKSFSALNQVDSGRKDRP